MKNKKVWFWISCSFFIIVCDQLTKYLVIEHLTEQSVVQVLPFLNFILRFNAGASFSFLGNASGWQVYLLSAVSIIVSIVLVVWLNRLARSEWLIAVPISLVLGGALGNLIDRVHYGFVVDFIDFHIGSWHYATFNIADSAVCVGATWLVLRLLYESIACES
ncbi:MAG: lipoprotein signal peptidase [uncultured bacterium]|nr:MAG: lipoprotein signal peptidase [uncultured bacterium]OGT33030.1 MAG: signal peptidase II [Gammaproteobacteria bacterium RIFCSPHIGHO2_02_FULL_39_13]OGT49771.1 MAG: signal peptidase II [Gammaproteobacteria bacterium RIFCSPHIGHO2_12_FULL_39_24]